MIKINYNKKFDPFAFVYKNITEKEENINQKIIICLDFLNEPGIYKFKFIKETEHGSYKIKHTYHLRNNDFLILDLKSVVAMFINGKYIMLDDDDRDINMIYDYYFNTRCDFFDTDILVDVVDEDIKFIRIL